MKIILWIMLLIAIGSMLAKENTMKFKELTPQEKSVIEDKGTEIPFTGKYNNFFKPGIYKCKRCGAALYRSSDKFNSQCGWPSFDDAIPGMVKQMPDQDGIRIEITCNNCGAHLGHVFSGENLTPKNIRHCVNSISLDFEPIDTAIAYVAGGCFWGVEHYMQLLPGVISAESGYMGGDTKDPDYYSVSSGITGHAETVKITFDPAVINYKNIIKRFFEIHDPTQINRQGPDHGSQYRSAVFFQNDTEKKIIQDLIDKLKANGYNVVTQVSSAQVFYPAERYHQDYYEKKKTLPYCHKPVDRFD